MIKFLSLFLLSATLVMADTPPPGSVLIKGGTDGTKIGNVSDALKVNVVNGGSTVNQGNAGSQSWLVDVTNTVPVTGTFFQSVQPVSQSGSWTVAATQSGSWTTGRTWVLSNSTDSVNVGNFPATQAVTQSGTWNINNISGAVSLPTGAATSALQSTINTTLGSPFQAGGSIGNTSFGATQGTSPWVDNVSQFGGSNVVTGTGASGSGIPRVTVSNDSNILATQSGTWNISNISGTVSLPTGAATSANQTNGSQITSIKANTNGSASNSTAVGGTAVTFSPPTNAVGFVVEAESSNTSNLRYACGTTATSTVGMLLEPGRDSGYVPSACTVTVIAVTGSSQSAGIQWVLSQ